MDSKLTLQTKIKGILRQVALEDEETILTLVIDGVSILSIDKDTGTLYKYNCLSGVVTADDVGEISEE